MQPTRRAVLAIVPLLTLALGLPGCAGVGALPQVVQAVSDGILIVEQVASWIAAYFAKGKADAAVVADVNAKVDAVRAALLVVNRIADGAASLKDPDVTAAIGVFSSAYLAMLGAAKAAGVPVMQAPVTTPAPAVKARRLAARTRVVDGTLVVPEPLLVAIASKVGAS